MKWPRDQVEILQTAITQVIENSGYSIEQIKKDYEYLPPMRLAWDLFRLARAGLQGHSSHCMKVESYVLYPEGCNDSHLSTALKHIMKNIGLWSE